MTSDLSGIPNPDARLRALEELDDWADDPESVLVSALWDSFPAVRFTAAAHLASRESAADRLVAILTGTYDVDATDDARRAAVLGLRRALNQDVLESVLDVSRDADPIVRYHAMLVIDANADRVDLKSIAERALGDDDDDVAVVGAQWASQFQWVELAPKIDRARVSRDAGDVRLQFAIALASLVPDSLPDGVVEDLINGLSDDRTARPAAFAIATAGVKEAIPSLVSVTRKLWYHVIIRIDAAAVLSALGHESGVSKLAKFIGDRREHVSAYACECVGRYALTPLESAVIEALQASDDRALSAVVTLRKLGTPSAVAALETAQSDHPSDAIRRAIEEIVA